MPKVSELNQTMSNIIHIFFDGELRNMDLTSLKEIYNDPTKNVDYSIISASDYKSLKKVINIINNPKIDIRILIKDYKKDTKTKTKTNTKTKTKSISIFNKRILSIRNTV